jgi:hypothetical protein
MILNCLSSQLSLDILSWKVDLRSIVALYALADLVCQLVTHIERIHAHLRRMLASSNQADFEPDPCLALDRWMDRDESAPGQKRVLLCLGNYERLGEFAEDLNG